MQLLPCGVDSRSWGTYTTSANRAAKATTVLTIFATWWQVRRVGRHQGIKGYVRLVKRYRSRGPVANSSLSVLIEVPEDGADRESLREVAGIGLENRKGRVRNGDAEKGSGDIIMCISKF